MRTSLLAVTTLFTLTGLAARPAGAHFHLNAPANYVQQNTSGDPQKGAPCGPGPGEPGIPTNAITTVQTGSMLTVTIDETIFHPGHYRISLAPNLAGLPADPTVTGANCASLAINPSPSLPLLADGVFKHTTAFSGPQSTQIQLPAGMECTNCVLQVTEFMSSHAAPCFYHHCATLTISNTAPDMPPQGGPDAGTGTDGGGTNPPVDEAGCCAVQGGGAAGSTALSLLALALVLRRRR